MRISVRHMILRSRQAGKNNLPKAFEYDEARRLVKYFYDTLAYMKLEKLIEARFVRLICLKKGAWLYLDTVEAMEKFFDSGYDKKPYAVIRDVCENLRKEGCCPP